jgi:hypothetical protein
MTCATLHIFPYAHGYHGEKETAVTSPGRCQPESSRRSIRRVGANWERSRSTNRRVKAAVKAWQKSVDCPILIEMHTFRVSTALSSTVNRMCHFGRQISVPVVVLMSRGVHRLSNLVNVCHCVHNNVKTCVKSCITLSSYTLPWKPSCWACTPAFLLH